MINPRDPIPPRKSRTTDPRTGPGPEDPPQDPPQDEPMRDPPIYPERDDVGVEEIRQAGGNYDIESLDSSPDSVVCEAITE